MLTRHLKRCKLRSANLLLGLIAATAGGLTTLAFAPTNFASMAILAPALLIILWHKASPKLALCLGFLYGFGFFLTSTWWVVISLHDYGQLPLSFAWLLALLFISYLSAFPALTGWLGIRFFKAYPLQLSTMVLPSLWVLTEWLRSTLFSGFPWMLMGYSQTNSWLAGLAPIIGSYGLSFVCLALAGTIAYVVHQKSLKQWVVASIAILSLFCLSLSLTYVPWTKPTDAILNVSLVQGNISQSKKWDQAQLFDILNIYAKLSREELGQDLIVLPESALPIADGYLQNYLNDLRTLTTNSGSVLIVGVPSQTKAMQENDRYYNALRVLNDQNTTYYKRHLVPFGEYLSFLDGFDFIFDLLQIPMASFIPGPQKIEPFKIKSLTIEPLICYEIAYSALVYDNLPEAEAILVVSDDSWFGDSAAAEQHLQIAQMRAIETHRSILFLSNTGITAIINSGGQIVQRIPQNHTAVLRGTINGEKGQTPITIWGDKAVLFFCVGLIGYISLRRKLLGKH